MGATTVMLVDDHAVVRVGFRLLLQSASDIEVVAEADSGEAACAMYDGTQPDVVVMDLSMDGMGGMEAIRRLLARDARARILTLSAHEDASYPKRALAAGALGYLSKRTAPDTLIVAIRSVAAGRLYMDPAIAQRLALRELTGDGSPVDQLSEREFEVFRQLAQGQSVNQIAERLHLSASTVGTHLYNIKQKLGAANQAEIALIAIRHGLIEA